MFGSNRKKKGRSYVSGLVILSLIIGLITALSASDMPRRSIDHGKMADMATSNAPVSAGQSGAASFSYPIPLPKFFIEFNLSLNYSSAGSKGHSGDLGLGWNLSIPKINRDVRGTLSDTTDDVFRLNVQRLINTDDPFEVSPIYQTVT